MMQSKMTLTDWIRATGLVIALGIAASLILIGMGLDKLTKKGAFAMKR